MTSIFYVVSRVLPKNPHCVPGLESSNSTGFVELFQFSRRKQNLWLCYLSPCYLVKSISVGKIADVCLQMDKERSTLHLSMNLRCATKGRIQLYKCNIMCHYVRVNIYMIALGQI